MSARLRGAVLGALVAVLAGCVGGEVPCGSALGVVAPTCVAQPAPAALTPAEAAMRLTLAHPDMSDVMITTVAAWLLDPTSSDGTVREVVDFVVAYHGHARDLVAARRVLFAARGMAP